MAFSFRAITRLPADLLTIRGLFSDTTILSVLVGTRPCSRYLSSSPNGRCPYFLPHLAATSRFSTLIVADKLSFHGLFPVGLHGYTQKRFKKKSATKAAAEEGGDDDDDKAEILEEVDGGEPQEWKDVKLSVYSARADSVLKGALGLSRTKVEEMFYEGRWRLNGEKVTKKSIELSAGDEMDMIANSNDKNPEFLDVSRVVVEDIGTAIMKSKITLQLKVWKKLAVENYKGPNKYSTIGN